MPEAPEIRILTEQLDHLLSNEVLEDIQIVKGPHKTFLNDINKHLKPFIKNKNNTVRFNGVKCKGKFIYFELAFCNDTQDIKYIGNHLGMTGHWRKDEGKHTMIKIYYKTSKGTNVLYFDDMRHFAKFYWLNKPNLLTKLNNLGPDILKDEFTIEKFNEIIKSKNIQNKMIGNVIVDQKLFSGIGNYLRADILYASQIFPRKKVKDIDTESLKTLYQAMKDIPYKAYIARGTTIRTYKDIEMNPGYYDPIIYGKKRDPLGNPVKTMILGGRTMWYVPKLQK